MELESLVSIDDERLIIGCIGGGVVSVSPEMVSDVRWVIEHVNEKKLLEVRIESYQEGMARGRAVEREFLLNFFFEMLYNEVDESKFNMFYDEVSCNLDLI